MLRTGYISWNARIPQVGQPIESPRLYSPSSVAFPASTSMNHWFGENHIGSTAMSTDSASAPSAPPSSAGRPPSPWSQAVLPPSIPTTPLSAEYTLVPTPPSVPAYLRLRRIPGLSSKTPEQAEAGIHGAWFASHVVHVPSGETVAMGRVIGDGGWYFHIIDLATSVEHQRKGLGAAILARCLQEIRDRAPEGPFVTLYADPPGRKLYERFGFRDSAPASVGMVRKA